jgi:hypothetical protein
VIGIPRGKYLGKLLGDPPESEAEHFIRCPACGGWIDCRDLGLKCSSTKGRYRIRRRIDRNDNICSRIIALLREDS